MYTCKDDLIPLLYSGKKKKKRLRMSFFRSKLMDWENRIVVAKGEGREWEWTGNWG